jgi:GPH family glycoside/pentoside/hexuronide:cation symporter
MTTGQFASQTPVVPRLSFFKKVIYGSGDWSLSSFTTLRAIFYAIFLTDVVRLRPELAGIGLLLGTAWDAINDPLVGMLNDRVRTRWGRRRPFLFIFALPFMIGFLILWWSPPWDSQILKMLYVTLAFMIGDTLHTLLNVPYLALIPDISRDYDERTALSGYRVFFNLLASLVTAVAAPIIVDDMVLAGRTAQQGYLVVAALFGGIAAIPFLIMPLVLRERSADLEAPQPMSLKEMWQVLWRNVPFRYAAGIYMLTWIAFDLVTRMIPYFLVYWVGGGDQLISQSVFGMDFPLESLVLGVLLIMAVVSIPLWTWLSKRLSKKMAYIIGMAFWVVVLAAMIVIQPGQINLMLVMAALAGLSVSTASVLPEALLPDVIDYDEYGHGVRNEGLYYGAISFFRKFSGALAGFLALQALGIFGYQAPPEGALTFAQSASALWAIRFMTGPFGAVMVALSILVAIFYPLSRERYAEIRLILDQRDAANEASGG